MANAVQEIDQMAVRAKKALAVMKTFSQSKVDEIVAAMATAGAANSRKLAEMAVAET